MSLHSPCTLLNLTLAPNALPSQNITHTLELQYLYQIQAMTDRRNTPNPKSSHQTPTSLNPELFDEKTRVFQKNLVFVSGLPLHLNKPQMLKSSRYFGRYGQVNKIIIKNISSYKKITSYQVYVTYESQFEASLAIVALDGFKLEQKPLKASYGTTKYCSYFLKGYECQNPNCYFLHKYEKGLQISNENAKSAYKEQSNEAFNKICQNVHLLLSEEQKAVNEESQGFPTFSEIIQFLVDAQYISEEQILKINKKKDTVKEESSNGEQVEKGLQKEGSLADTLELEDRIQKMIIRKLFRTNTKARSKMNFVKSDKAETNQLVKLRGIVQQYLISNN